MRGLRFHFFSEVGRPGYVRGVGLEVFEVFRTAMRELGLVMQVFCDWQLMEDLAAIFRISGREVVSRGIATRQPGVADVGNGLATPGAIMPDDGHLFDLFCQWTPDEQMRRCILRACSGTRVILGPLF